MLQVVHRALHEAPRLCQVQRRGVGHPRGGVGRPGAGGGRAAAATLLALCSGDEDGVTPGMSCAVRTC